MRLSKIILVMCAVWCSISTANAGIILSLDMDSADGIQSTNSSTVRVGDLFTANLVLDLSTPSVLSSYAYTVVFDRNVLAMTARAEFPYGILNVDNDNRSNTIDNVNGLARNFDGGTVVGTGQAALGAIVVGTVSFRVLSDANPTTLIRAFDFDKTFDLFLDPAVNDLTPSVVFNPGTLNITAVPEPTSALLFGFGCLGLSVSRRLFRQRANGDENSLREVGK